ncbi:sugar porter family MFS transporter [Sphingobacterium alkalisoli]|uniref:Sugar porter family MFS transporter n=1 Tax=Sphingobacterium alkalisoli TaxID=1874115 RepID=A0A4U0H653_9SPHI|nr:MFS transporter [Sphingobacterium alkalisoli]TJY66734.1 sugar porter family MFS transporter [Sphingobacterium alkalisoli]GGH14524.1 hypothetical protein GCM10011418_15540 [Sphingobacterium alkalisoli]
MVNQLTIVLGILLPQVINYLIAKPVVRGEALFDSWNTQMDWRWMFWSEGLPAFLFFLLLFVVPESPKWLSTKGKYDQSKKILLKIGAQHYTYAETHAVGNTLTLTEEGSNYALFRGKTPRILLISDLDLILKNCLYTI